MKHIITILIFLYAITPGSIAQNSAPYWSLAGNNNATGLSKLGTTNQVSLHFYTNNLQRMYIDSSSGRVGIGITNPSNRLQVNSLTGENPFMATVNGVSKLLVYTNGGVAIGSKTIPPPNGLYVLGNAGIGTNTPAYKLDVQGTAGIRNTLTVTDGGIIATNNTGYGLQVTSAAKNEEAINAGGVNTGIYAYAAEFGVYGYGYSPALEDGEEAGYGVYGNGLNIGLSGYGGEYGADCSGSTGIHANTTTSGGYAGVFNGNIYSSGSYTGSDVKLKKNISTFDNAMKIINRLQPKNYEYRSDSNYRMMNLPTGSHYGFIAQDVEKILPGLVKQSAFNVTRTKKSELYSQIPKIGKSAVSDSIKKITKNEYIDFKAVNYTELIPILVKAMQEQQNQIQDLQNEVNDLKLIISKGGTSTKSSEGYLKQNIPNPSGNNTIIDYYLPVETVYGRLIITDQKGSLVKIYSASKGKGQLTVNNAQLSAGVYNYTLYANNKIVDSKQMIVAK